MKLLPEAKSVLLRKGTFFIDENTSISMDASQSENLAEYGDILKKEIKDVTGFKIKVTDHGLNENTIVIADYDPEYGDQEYLVSVGSSRVILAAKDEQGILYAIETLRQLIREYKTSIPAMEIMDKPEILVRGYSYDTTRGRVPKVSELKRVIDTCAFYKINHLELNIEHSFAFKNEEAIWKDVTPLTGDDILEACAYARKFHIDLVPMVASFGHLYALLQNPEYAELCELNVDVNEGYSLVNRMRHHTIDPSNPKSFKVVTERIKELSECFSSKYINICADETFDLGKGKNKKRAEKEGSERIYIEFLKKLCDYVISIGKIPLYWGDIIVKTPGIINELPKEAICLNWEYDPVVREDNIKAFTKAGAENIYMCPGVQSWSHLVNRHHDAYENISGMLKLAHKYGAKGIINTDWGDLGHIAHPEFSTVGIIYGASFAWNKNIIAEKDINERISYIQYKDETGTFVDTCKELSEKEPFSWWAFVQYKETHEGLIYFGADPKDKAEPERFDNVISLDKARKLPEKITETEEILKKLSEYESEASKAYIIMGRGQIVLSHIGILMVSKAYNENIDAGVTKDMVTEEIDTWFKDYGKLWRLTSKESELFRLKEIFDWYKADTVK